MTRALELSLGNETAVVQPYEDEAPQTIDALRSDALPWSTRSAQHARFPLPEFWCDAPLVFEQTENQADHVEAGEVGYFPQLPALVCWYEETDLLAPSNIFGKITQNLSGIQREAPRTWYERDVPMEIREIES